MTQYEIFYHLVKALMAAGKSEQESIRIALALMETK